MNFPGGVSFGSNRGQIIDPSIIKKLDPSTIAAMSGAVQTPSTPITTLLQPPNAPEATPTIGVPAAPINGQAPASSPDAQFLQSLQTGPTGQYTFPNDASRTLAINSGQYDPAYPSSLQKALAISIGNDRTATQNALIAHKQAANPLASATTPQEITAAQLAGDRDGTIKKILMANQPNPLESDMPLASDLHPYMGSLAPNDRGVNGAAPLDYNIIHNPDFAKKYAQDPIEGRRIYKAITGRDMEADTAKTQEHIKNADDFERSMFQDNIKNGAQPPDSPGGSWKIWQQTEPDTNANQMSLGQQSQRPTRKLRDATPIENAIMNRQYNLYDPKGLPKPQQFGSLMTRNSNAVVQQSNTDPALKTKLQAAAQAKGQPLNPAEIFAIGNQHADLAAANEYAANPTTLNLMGYSPGPGVTSGLMKMKDLIANIAGFKGGKDVTEPQEPNALGKFFTDPFKATPQASLSDASFDAASNY